MKKLLLFFCILFFAFVSQGQNRGNGRHVSLAACGGDTLRYIRVNLLQNKDRYIGLKVDSLFKDLEIPIKSFGPTITTFHQVDGMLWTYLSGSEREDFEKKGKMYYHIFITCWLN